MRRDVGSDLRERLQLITGRVDATCALILRFVFRASTHSRNIAYTLLLLLAVIYADTFESIQFRQ